MNIEDIKTNKELMQKLSSLHKSLTNLMKDSIYHDKFSYREHEVNLTLDHNVVNQHIAENRMFKIKNLMDLSNNWDAFKTLYKDDLILKKIGVEFLDGKFEFNKEIINTIKEYPHRKEVLYYFQKGVDVNLGNATPEDYSRIRNQILPDIQEDALFHMQQKKALIRVIGKIAADKSQYNLNYLGGLTEKENPGGQINVEYGRVLSEVLTKIRQGDFITQQDENEMIVELPIPGIKKEGEQDVKSSTILLKVDMENPRDYFFEVGSLQKLNANIADKINSIREKAFNFKGLDTKLKVN
jgi:hypothetical protein